MGLEGYIRFEDSIVFVSGILVGILIALYLCAYYAYKVSVDLELEGVILARINGRYYHNAQKPSDHLYACIVFYAWQLRRRKREVNIILQNRRRARAVLAACAVCMIAFMSLAAYLFFDIVPVHLDKDK
jgi:hypothetical protein